MGRTWLLVALLLFGLEVQAFAATQIDELKREYRTLENKISDARAKHEQLADGLLKSLVAVRLELLSVNAALIQQRIHAEESGAKVSITVTSTKPNADRAAELESEMRVLQERIAAQEAESAQYRGGLVKAMLESGIATNRVSLAMLETEYLKAKYGIHWPPPLKYNPETEKRQVPTTGSDTGGSRQQTSEAKEAANEAVRLLLPRIMNKRYRPRDLSSRIYEDAIFFDIAWDTSKLKRPVRAVKGILIFADLFGEPNFRIRLTIDDRLSPGEKHMQSGIGFKYNRFSDDHLWMRTTELKNMTFRFDAREILYEDGTKEKFGPVK